jgi:hypothetical protein
LLRFIDSESTLDSSLHSLTLTLPQNPKLFYPEFVKQGSVALLAELLSHENTDIALDVVTVLVELTEEDVEGGESDEEDEEEDEGGSGARGGMGSLIGALVSRFGRICLWREKKDIEGEADQVGIVLRLRSLAGRQYLRASHRQSVPSRRKGRSRSYRHLSNSRFVHFSHFSSILNLHPLRKNP